MSHKNRHFVNGGNVNELRIKNRAPIKNSILFSGS